jgi:hypothetical protein
MRSIRIILGTILAIIALNAFGGGYYGIAGAKKIPVEWLKNSPLHSYFFPGLFLFIVIGGACLIGSIAVFKNSMHAKKISYACSALLTIWIIAQVTIIGYVSWMQPAIIIFALCIFVLARKLQHATRENTKGVRKFKP